MPIPRSGDALSEGQGPVETGLGVAGANWVTPLWAEEALPRRRRAGLPHRSTVCVRDLGLQLSVRVTACHLQSRPGRGQERIKDLPAR
jgi:hypothetical protein